jgi:hypothetical protein
LVYNLIGDYMTYSPAWRGNTATGTILGIESSLRNGTALTISKYSPVAINGSGDIQKSDATNEALSFSSIGILKADCSASAVGDIVTSGRIIDVDMPTFSFGDAIYIGSTPGTLTNIKPTDGIDGFIAGNYVVRIGMILKNETDPLKKDLFVSLMMCGQL